MLGGVSDFDDLDFDLEAAVQSAEQRWSAVATNRAEFVRYLAERLPTERPAAESLAAVAIDDLYLAWACSKADPAALALFEASFLCDVGSYVASVERAPAFADEVRQALREKLFSGSSE